ncbi:unnamed protein product [Discula destructiva]
MLPCSVRRVAATTPQSPLLSSLPRAAASCTYRPSQRRRYSSSKPSRDNGSEDKSVRQSVQPAAETKTGEAKASGEKRRRKTKDASDKLKYPSVPTTAHIPSDCKSTLQLHDASNANCLFPFSSNLVLALSSFFSLHRPISVTRGLPRNVSDDAFASIFAVPTRSQKAAEVMSTLSRTVEDLEQPMSGLSLQQQQQHQHQAAVAAEADAAAEAHNEEMRKLDLRNADGSAASLSVQVNNMVGQFLPFRPPPLPQAETPASKKAAAAAAKKATNDATLASAEENEEDVQTRVYKAVFTIEETTDGNGEVKIVAHSPELIEDPDASSSRSLAGGRAQASATMTISMEGGDAAAASTAAAEPRTFLERMALRQLQFHEAQSRLRRPAMWTISVKRQRKLKMKKKKYKKLTRRLRHERLKHGRT